VCVAIEIVKLGVDMFYGVTYLWTELFSKQIRRMLIHKKVT